MTRTLFSVVLAMTLLAGPAQANKVTPLRLAALSGVCGAIIGTYGLFEGLRGHNWLENGDEIRLSMMPSADFGQQARDYQRAVESYVEASDHSGAATVLLMTSAGFFGTSLAVVVRELRRTRQPYNFTLTITEVPEDGSIFLNGWKKSSRDGQVHLRLNHLDDYRIEFVRGGGRLLRTHLVPAVATQAADNRYSVTFAELFRN